MTEMLGVLVTIFVIDQLAIGREKERLRKRLIRQAGSPSQAVATEAIAQLREEGWLEGEGGLLQNANLRGANLAGADLTNANLRGAKLYQANLSSAILEYADLRDTDLRDVDLSCARLQKANFEKADLTGANLKKSFPWEASFKSAILSNVDFTESTMPLADFSHANTECAIFDGSNLKGSIFIQTHLIGTSFAGTNLIRAKFERSSYGFAYTMPEEKLYLMTLPDGRKAIPSMESKDLEYLNSRGFDGELSNCITFDEIDWNEFTDSQHPNCKMWNFEWRKEQYKK